MYDLSIDELESALKDFDEYIDKRGWDSMDISVISIVSCFMDFIEYGDCEPRWLDD